MKRNNPLTAIHNKADRSIIMTFQPRQVTRLANFIRSYNIRVMAYLYGSMSDIHCAVSNLDQEFFCDDLHRLAQYKSPVVTVRITPYLRRVIILRIDQTN